MHENRETSEIPAANVSRRTAGEGSSHTARVYVSEESHRGIVPMNHSNKDGTSSAESEEGRLRIKGTLSHLARTRHRAGLSVSHGWASVRRPMLGRYLSEIRTGCANERPSGSVRGAPGNWCPSAIASYRTICCRHQSLVYDGRHMPPSISQVLPDFADELTALWPLTNGT